MVAEATIRAADRTIAAMAAAMTATVREIQAADAPAATIATMAAAPMANIPAATRSAASWRREVISNGRYGLFDRQGRQVVGRAANRLDFERMDAARR
jgi:hypothetical protein